MSIRKLRATAAKNVLLNHSCFDCAKSITRNIWGIGDNITFCTIHSPRKRKLKLGFKHICELYEYNEKL
jgi:hypothetical protein